MAKDWTALLENLLPHPCPDRPLVCDGLPDASQVIIIGQNPATDMDTDWWTYWRPQTGFEYDRFIADYQRQRAKKGKRPISSTRMRLNRVREQGICAVETNTYRNQGAGRTESNRDLLHLLIQNMSDLKAVIAYGKHAQTFANEANLPDNLPVFPLDHFRSISYAELDKKCREVASLLLNS